MQLLEFLIIATIVFFKFHCMLVRGCSRQAKVPLVQNCNSRAYVTNQCYALTDQCQEGTAKQNDLKNACSIADLVCRQVTIQRFCILQSSSYKALLYLFVLCIIIIKWSAYGKSRGSGNEANRQLINCRLNINGI